MESLKILGVVLLLYIAYKHLAFIKRCKAVAPIGSVKTFLLAGKPLSEVLPGIFIGPININMPSYYQWSARYGWHQKFNSTIVAIVSWCYKSTYFYVADEEAIQVIVNNRDTFKKPLEMYGVLSIFGQNVLTTEDDVHRRHRKITAPAFGESNNSLVWQEAISVTNDWFEDVERRRKLEGGDPVTENIVSVTLRAALHIISSAAFGMKLEWSGNLAPSSGHRLNFRDALSNVLEYLFVKIMAPDWMYTSPLPNFVKKHLDATKVAHDELDDYMSEIITKRIESNEESKDLLSLLVASFKEDNTKSAPMPIRDIKGNIYIFLIAGHETTAHTLAFCFALLALNPEEQDLLYEETSKMPEKPNYSEFGKMTRTLAVFFEALRMFPAVPHIPKVCPEPTMLPFTTANGSSDEGKQQLSIPAGSYVFIDTMALHHSPRLWGEDAMEFKPSRFIDTDEHRWPRNGFIPFSGGTRNCLGQRFAQVESVAIIAMVSKYYRLSIAEEHLAKYKAGKETYAQMKEKLFSADQRCLFPIPTWKVVDVIK